MPQRLDASDQLDAQCFCIRVKPPDHLRRIAPAHVSPERFAGKIIGILGIEHQQIVTAKGKMPKPAIEILFAQHHVSGDVDHDALSAKIRMLFTENTGQRRSDSAPGSTECGRFNQTCAIR